jgi:hypothetical protein
MKVPIDSCAAIDLDAPVLAAKPVRRRGRLRWRVWCKRCREWHIHGPGDGHREAHCCDESSPYIRTGYNLAGPVGDDTVALD